MEQSILLSVKKLLGIDQSYCDFDLDIIMSINSAIHTLYQVGYERAKNFIIEGTDEKWKDLAGDNPGGVLSLIKTYIYTKVRMLFDPPTSSFVLTSLENQSKELEWRIYAEMEGGFENGRYDEEDDCDCACARNYRPDQEYEHDHGHIHHQYQHHSYCGGHHHNPWRGVPNNGPDLSEGPADPELSGTLRRLRDEMGRP